MKKRLRRKALRDPGHPLHPLAIAEQERREKRAPAGEKALSLLAIAEQALGSARLASLWMQRPNRALGGMAPAEVAAERNGVAEVRRVLGRIEHGIIS